MPPKGKKKDPNAPTLIPEDTYVRAKKLMELKVAPKAPKGGGIDLTSEEWCIPPAFHSIAEFKQAIIFWQQCAIVQYKERMDLKAVSRMKYVDDDEKAAKKPHPNKEIKDMFKFLKSQAKQATKRTGQFLKQLEKKEKKELKRETLLQNIANVDKQMNEELKASRNFVEKQDLFGKYMTGSKLGDKGPRKNALIVMELSDKQAAWADEMKDEVIKLLNTVIDEDTESFNLATFNATGVNTWCPQFQSKTDPKKGLADSLKWLNKNCSAKAAGPHAFPPDYIGMLQKFTAEGQSPPFRIFLCCSRSPEGATSSTLAIMKQLRQDMDPPGKGEPVLPINVVAFDPTIVGDEDEKNFFEALAGPNGSSMIDTSAEDLAALDKMLKAVQVKKKQLDKLNKKLLKMEDLSERVAEDRRLLQVQIALQSMLQSDMELCDWALKNEAPVVVPDI